MRAQTPISSIFGLICMKFPPIHETSFPTFSKKCFFQKMRFWGLKISIGVSTSFLPPFIVDLLALKIYPRSNSFSYCKF